MRAATKPVYQLLADVRLSLVMLKLLKLNWETVTQRNPLHVDFGRGRGRSLNSEKVARSVGVRLSVFRRI